jgi:large subunit ribosomal protein L1
MTKIKKTLRTDKLEATDLESGIRKIQEISEIKKRNFIESVDLSINLGIDPKQSDQNVKGSVVLPHGSGKKVRVIVFSANESQKQDAIESGAIEVGLEDLITKIEDGFLGFDCCIATPEVMQKISKVAKKLGPRGLMPTPKNGTVTTDVKKAVSDAMRGKVNFKNDKSGTIHCMIGKVTFAPESLVENARLVIKTIRDSKPETSKGKFIKDFYLNSTMGPSIKISTESL